MIFESDSGVNEPFAGSEDLPSEPIDWYCEPETYWGSVTDDTRCPPAQDDQVAQFLLQQNPLMIGADVRGFSHMVDRGAQAYLDVAGREEPVRDVVHECIEQRLIKAVMTAQARKRTDKWSVQQRESLWSEVALTTAALPRWHVNQSIRRSIEHRLGTLGGGVTQ